MDLTPVTDPAVIARALDDAHLEGRTLAAPGIAVGDLASAYVVQRALTARRLARGGRVVGWKLGYTSQVMREQMGIEAPNFGPLLSSMVLDEGVIGAGFTQPRVEPEIALVLARDPGAEADVDGVLAATSSARAALEVVDSVWSGYAFDLEHNTADGSSAAGVVLGAELPLDGLPDLGVTLLVDGVLVGEGAGRDAGGHPAYGVAWLAARLAERGEPLRPGDVVITGGLTAAAPVPPGSVVHARFRSGAVEVGEVRARRSAG